MVNETLRGKKLAPASPNPGEEKAPRDATSRGRRHRNTSATFGSTADVIARQEIEGQANGDIKRSTDWRLRAVADTRYTVLR